MKSCAPSSTGAGYPRIDETNGSHPAGSRGTAVLTELHVSNLAVMEEVRVQLGPGLNVLTGETGAGKSLVVGAIDLVLGARASADIVRRGASEAEIIARFDLPGNHFERQGIEQDLDEGSLLLRRVIGADGRSRCYVNDRPTTVGRLRDLGKTLADLHGQHEQQNLLREETHLSYLDAFAGSGELVDRVRSAYESRRAAEHRLQEHREASRKSAEEREYLHYQLEELESAELVEGEEESLEREHHLAAHANRLAEYTDGAFRLLAEGDPSGQSLLAAACRLLAQGAALDPELEPLRRQLDEAVVTGEEIARELSGYRDGLQFDPQRLEEIAARLSALHGLRRKYHTDTAGLIALRDSRREELAGLDDASGILETLEAAVEEGGAVLLETCAELSTVRSRAAARLGRGVTRELTGLGMEEARFRVDLAPPATGVDLPGGVRAGSRGAESATFLLAANPGEKGGAIGRMASGGEASRVMLALKNVLREVDPVPLVIFDEVDAGIGGLVASAVGTRLVAIARSRQVLVVTHLAVIAGKADRHLRLEKTTRGGRARIYLQVIDGEEREEEVARMLAGEEGGKDARRTARSLLGEGNRG